MNDLRDRLTGALVMAPMTKGSNLPYRRLCQELGATLTMSEMTVARKLRRRSRGEFALIQRASDERFFGVQLAGRDPEEMGWAAGLVESRGADLVDVNLGCPIDAFTRRGLGAALLRRPRKVRGIVEAMKRGVTRIPVTVKIRLGWNDDELNFVDVARAAVDGGADAIFVHGRTRNARYRRAADWSAIADLVRALPVPVVGNGDILYPHDVERARETSGCVGVMIARGALIKPWIFQGARDGVIDETPERRWRVYERYVALGLEHWGRDERGMAKFREFLVWHLGFWCRFTPRRPDGSFPTMQEREAVMAAASPAEALLARADGAVHAYLANRLLEGSDLDAAVREAPPVADAPDGLRVTTEARG